MALEEARRTLVRKSSRYRLKADGEALSKVFCFGIVDEYTGIKNVLNFTLLYGSRSHRTRY